MKTSFARDIAVAFAPIMLPIALVVTWVWWTTADDARRSQYESSCWCDGGGQ
jgi:hypothetical protein